MRAPFDHLTPSMDRRKRGGAAGEGERGGAKPGVSPPNSVGEEKEQLICSTPCRRSR